jgi:hypothetical protein
MQLQAQLQQQQHLLLMVLVDLMQHRMQQQSVRERMRGQQVTTVGVDL